MKSKRSIRELPADRLRWECDPKTLQFDTTNQLGVTREIIGQERAINAIRLGLEVFHEGYNIFVTGMVGTGRTTTIGKLLEELEQKEGRPQDVCYVNNFRNPDMPKVLLFKAGDGTRFKRDMENLVEVLRRRIPSVFESEYYINQRKGMVEQFEEKSRARFKDFEKRAQQEGYAVVRTQMGPFVKSDLLPVLEGNPVTIDQLEQQIEQGKMTREKLDDIRKRQGVFEEELRLIFKEARNTERQINDGLRELNRRVATPIIEELLDDIMTRYGDGKVNGYLEEVAEAVLGDLERFLEKEEPSPVPMPKSEDRFVDCQVNVVVDNSETKGPPIIAETSPNYRNLFGTIERVVDRMGGIRTDFTKIKAGSLLRANGGFLVLNALDVLMESGVWQTLKRTLRNGVVDIQTYDPFYIFATTALKPEPIECTAKVVMIGNPYLYMMLYSYDEDFKKIFKVKADFDNVMPNAAKTRTQYASFICFMCREEKLLPFDRTGVAEVIEYSARIAGRQKRLTTRFHIIADVLREADYWARKDKVKAVSGQHVEKALAEWVKRVGLTEEKISEMIEDGTVMIDTAGREVGQVNGLSVYSTGEYSFGKPTRITAKTSIGRGGIINIEREADLSGRIHNKGVLILSGYLRAKYGQEKPLVMTASICFEQSYGEVEGDSASSTELYAILSSLADVPIRQDIAVTGSVNQKGEVQPIGGVNQKIEGFFDVCKTRKLTGKQGVMIPYLNVPDLMLKREVVEAVRRHKFCVYAVKTIDEGVEILTGIKAGKKLKTGLFEKGSINYSVDRRLRDLAMNWQKFGGEDEGGKSKDRSPKGANEK